MASERLKEQADRQLPEDDEIFLDHVSHFVADAQAARAALARAGFAPTPVSIQTSPNPAGGPFNPSGTGNITAMFARGYVEVLFKTADTELGRQFDAARARYPGLHLAAFTVADASIAHRRLAKHFRMQPLVPMQRPVDTEQGADIAAFTIARVMPGEMAEGRVQILTHRTEHTVWQKRWLDHANGAVGLASVTIAVADVAEAAERFSRFTDRPARSHDGGQVITLDRGRVELVTSEAFARAFPGLTVPSLPFIGACDIEVRALDTTAAVVRKGGLSGHREGDQLILPFPAELGIGAWRFRERSGGQPGSFY